MMMSEPSPNPVPGVGHFNRTLLGHFWRAAKGDARLSRRCIRVHPDKHLRLTGLKRPGISNHALRHTAATLGYLHTGDLRAVQEFLGHADPRMTSKYAHVVDMAKKNPALFIPVKVG
jgi:integrase